VKPDAQRFHEVDVANPQVGDLLRPRPTVVEQHEERSVTKR
jgi:hypothetical protein